MDKLRILLLGSPEVMWRGESYPIARRLSRALLFYLACQTEPVSRSQILLLFWPDLDEHSARANLRDYLGKLRANLPDPNMVKANLNSISVDLEKVEVDLLEFTALTRSVGRIPWQIPLEQPLPDQIYQLMVKAINLWRLPTLLQGFSIPGSNQWNEWVSQTEQNLLGIRNNFLQRIVSHADASGDFMAVVSWIRLALVGDPYNEEFHRKLIEALLRSGNRAEAITHGNKVSQLFLKDLGEQPSVELQDLIQTIQKDNKKNELNKTQLSKTISGLVTSFVGREAEVNRLTLADVQGRIVLLRGETGIGKTRLVYEYYRRSTRPYQMVIAPCLASTRTIPYQPFISMIRNDIKLLEQAGLTREEQQKLFSIDSTLSPNQSTTINDPWQMDQSDAPNVNDLFRRFFQGLVTKGRLLIFVDDAQWIDEASIHLIKSLVQFQFIPSNAFLILACDLSKQNPSFAGLLSYLYQKDICSKITIQPLSLQETTTLASTVGQKIFSAEQLENLVSDTNGNPLMIIEIIRSVLYHKTTIPTSSDRKIIPGSIRSVFRDRYNLLPSLQQQILSIGAVTGTRFSIELLESISQHPAEEIVEGLEDLERIGILKVMEDTSNHEYTYQFAQNIFKEVVLLEMSVARKRLLHRRIAHIIEQSSPYPDDVLAAIVAEHYTSSGDLNLAFKFWLNAARYARRLSSPQDAYRAYQKAEQIFPSIDMQMSDKEILEFYKAWAKAAYQIQDNATTERIGFLLFNLGEIRSSATLMGSGLYLQSMARFGYHDYLAGLNICEQALRYLKESNATSEWLKCMARKSKFLYMLSYFEEAKQNLEETIRSLPETMDEEIQSSAGMLYYDYSTVLLLMGFPKRSLEMAEKSHQLYIQTKDLEGEAKVFGQMVLSSVYYGENYRAEQEADVGLGLARKISYKRMEAYIQAYVAFAKTALGKMDHAWDSAQKALEISNQNPFPEIASAALRTCGDIHRYLLDYRTAIDFYIKGYEVEGDKIVKFDHLARRGYLTGLLGDITGGLGMLEEAYRAASDLRIGSVRISCRLYQILVMNSQQELENFKKELEGLIQESAERNLITQWCVGQSIKARLLLLKGDISAGDHLLELALQRGSQMNGIWPQLIYQHFLVDQPGTIQPVVVLKWKRVLQKRLEVMSEHCQGSTTLPLVMNFRKTIDKTT